MSTAAIAVGAFEILNTRGDPIIRTELQLGDCRGAAACVPLGAFAGENEALELRDGDPRRHGGKGTLRAVANVVEQIAPKVVALDSARQVEIDRSMVEIVETEGKSKLGANAILGASMVVARAGAGAAGLPLYAYLSGTAPSLRHFSSPSRNVRAGRRPPRSVEQNPPVARASGGARR